MNYDGIADTERLGLLTTVMILTNEHNLRKCFHLSTDKELSEEDKIFICKIMKLDPRDRPTVKKLLHDEWFRQERPVDTLVRF